jgi:hypothetical protein
MAARADDDQVGIPVGRSLDQPVSGATVLHQGFGLHTRSTKRGGSRLSESLTGCVRLYGGGAVGFLPGRPPQPWIPSCVVVPDTQDANTAAVKDGPAAKELHPRRRALRPIFAYEDAVHSVAAGDEHRSVAPVDNLEAGRSEDSRLDRSMATVAQDDQIDFESSRFIEDRLGGAIAHNVCFYRDIRRWEPPRGIVRYAPGRNFDSVLAFPGQIRRQHHARVSRSRG